MQKRLIAFVCLLALSACAESPTSALDLPQAPRNNDSAGGGWTAGSGNKAQPAPDTTTTTSTSTANTETCEPDERGGWTAGSGNVVCVAP